MDSSQKKKYETKEPVFLVLPESVNLMKRYGVTSVRLAEENILISMVPLSKG